MESLTVLRHSQKCRQIVVRYEETEYCIKTSDGNSYYFKVVTRVKRGCVLLPFLFFLVVDYIFRQINGHRTRIAGKLLQDVDFVNHVGEAYLQFDNQNLQKFLSKLPKKAEPNYISTI